VCLVGLCWLAVVGSACSGSVDDTEHTGSKGVDAQDSEHTSRVVDRRSVIYSDEEAGVDALVESYLVGRHLFVRHRTLDESWDERVAELDNLRSLSAARRDRIFFEQQVSMVLMTARQVSPEEIEQIEGSLSDAFNDSLDLCAEGSEYPGIELYARDEGIYQGEDGLYYPRWSVEEEATNHGITIDVFLDLRHECHKFAASYPVLDPEQRDELLKTRRDYYLEILRLWMADHPEWVVPLDYENSVNQPYQDWVREVCMEAEDPEECVRGEGVSWP